MFWSDPDPYLEKVGSGFSFDPGQLAPGSASLWLTITNCSTAVSEHHFVRANVRFSVIFYLEF